MKNIIIVVAIAFLLPVASTALADGDARETGHYLLAQQLQQDLFQNELMREEREKRQAREKARQERRKEIREAVSSHRYALRYMP